MEKFKQGYFPEGEPCPPGCEYCAMTKKLAASARRITRESVAHIILCRGFQVDSARRLLERENWDECSEA